jgi:hypothetical protein
MIEEQTELPKLLSSSSPSSILLLVLVGYQIVILCTSVMVHNEQIKELVKKSTVRATQVSCREQLGKFSYQPLRLVWLIPNYI